jgi:hypothetical protein
MSALSKTLDEVRKRIAQYQGKEMNEQNTKTALIDPVLRALGWDVGNLEEVSQEYKRRPKDKPVDYALFLLRTPKLFLEAKALGESLDAPKWTNQIMGYAAVGGIKWVVMSNGDEYRIYNSCVDVPVEEKVFRVVRLSDPNSSAEETLALLSKDRIRDNDIEVLWKAHFVDRQVRRALEQLFSPDADPSLMRLVKRRVRELSSREIRASLGRVRAQFDFPIEPEAPAAVPKRHRKDEQAALASIGGRKTAKVVGVSLREVIDAGVLKAPLKLTVCYKKKEFEAELLSDGTVRFQGNVCDTCSMAADLARSTVTGRRMSTNGWIFWRYRDEAGKLVPLDNARQQYLK